MLQDKNGNVTIVGGISIGAVCLVAFIGLIILKMWGCPKYNVYEARLEGEAQLAHAVSSKEVAVAEAKAKMESASYEAQADTIRAHGIAASNRIIGQSLQGNPAYLQWLWIDNLVKTKNQIIYIPAGQMGMPVMEAGRLSLGGSTIDFKGVPGIIEENGK